MTIEGTNPRILALCEHLNESGEDIRDLGDNVYELSGAEYLVLTDAEAQKAAIAYIRDSVWAFRPEWIASHLKDDVEVTVDDVRALQEARSEDCNGAILAWVDEEYFVRDSILADGRGAFLNHYDGEEGEQNVGGVTWYIYRIN